jgi:hypothetical protein
MLPEKTELTRRCDHGSPLGQRKQVCRQADTSGPLKRTMPRMAPPGAEAIAAIVSSVFKASG